MGYYATNDGWIKFTSKPSVETIEKLDNVFEIVNEEDGILYFSGNGKYYDDSVYEILEEIEPITDSGFMEYTGEDCTHWRFFFDKDDMNHTGRRWIEEDGHVVYDFDSIVQANKDEFLSEVINEIQNCKEESIDKAKSKLESIMKKWRVLR